MIYVNNAPANNSIDEIDISKHRGKHDDRNNPISHAHTGEGGRHIRLLVLVAVHVHSDNTEKNIIITTNQRQPYCSMWDLSGL